MSKTIADSIEQVLGQQPNQPKNSKQKFLQKIFEKKLISRNIHKEFQDKRTFGEQIADQVAHFGGSWTFIITFLGILIVWVGLNTFVLARYDSVFDPYPYILLNLFLSMIAALQAPVIMMSQNRQAIKDRLAAEHDYEVNLKCEMEIQLLHEKFDELRESKWVELVQMQHEQIKLLTSLLTAKSGVSSEIEIN